MAESIFSAKTQMVLSAYSVNRRMINHLHGLTKKQAYIAVKKNGLFFPLKQVVALLETDVSDRPINTVGYINSYEPRWLYSLNLLPGNMSAPAITSVPVSMPYRRWGDSDCKPANITV